MALSKDEARAEAYAVAGRLLVMMARLERLEFSAISKLYGDESGAVMDQVDWLAERMLEHGKGSRFMRTFMDEQTSS